MAKPKKTPKRAGSKVIGKEKLSATISVMPSTRHWLESWRETVAVELSESMSARSAARAALIIRKNMPLGLVLDEILRELGELKPEIRYEV